MKIISFLVILFSITQNIFCQKIESPLINKWESFSKTRSGMGTTLDFNSDGTVVFTKSAMANYLYGCEDGKLITSRVNFETMRPRLDTTSVKIHGDTLSQYYFYDGMKKLRVMFRLTGKPDSIVGKWYSKNSAGQTYYYDFRNDHTMYFRLPYMKKTGTFELKGDSVIITYENSKPAVYTFRISNKNLFITSEEGNIELSYHKAF